LRRCRMTMAHHIFGKEPVTVLDGSLIGNRDPREILNRAWLHLMQQSSMVRTYLPFANDVQACLDIHEGHMDARAIIAVCIAAVR
jgi:hypothetical protein